VRNALESLPWVEKGSVEADVQNQQATFVIKDKEQFDKEALGKAIDKAGFELGKVVKGP
jgi:hypothetical protein